MQIGVTAACLVAGSGIAHAGPFPAEFELSRLLPENGGDGSEGFVLYGIDQNDQSGISVSVAGDLNGDGLDDLVIGAFRAAPDDRSQAGESYVVFGREAGYPAEFELSNLATGDGSSGFVLDGVDEGDWSGVSVSSAEDINGDGIDELVIGAPHAQVGGQSYIVFGRDTAQTGNFAAVFELSSLLPENGGDGSTGFVVSGMDFDDRTGYSVSAAGDVNGDGTNDLIIGAPEADREGRSAAGESYVVFGRNAGFPAEIEVATLALGDGSEGFVLYGIDQNDRSGISVSGAGDLNGDGVDDFVIGAYGGDPGGRIEAGESYVVFGRNTAHVGNFPAQLELSSLLPENGGDGSAGFVLNGVDSGDYSGITVHGAGDINDDRVADLLLGARLATPTGRPRAGQGYVVFGRDTAQTETFPAEVELSSLLSKNGGDGSAGFVLNGIQIDDWAGGRSVSAAGDINGDDVDDLLVGAIGADPHGRGGAGETYAVFGGDTGFPAEIELASLTQGDGTNGFVVNGIDDYDRSGIAVSDAGDVNGDGIDDLIIGAIEADPGGRESAGESYLVFGRAAESFGATVVGINARFAGCVNTTDPQSVFTSLPELKLTESWNCEELGMTVSSGDVVRLSVGGTGYTPLFQGSTEMLASGGEALCRNITQGINMMASLTPDGEWSCTAAGLPVATGDRVRAIINGTIE